MLIEAYFYIVNYFKEKIMEKCVLSDTNLMLAFVVFELTRKVHNETDEFTELELRIKQSKKINGIFREYIVNGDIVQIKDISTLQSKILFKIVLIINGKEYLFKFAHIANKLKFFNYEDKYPFSSCEFDDSDSCLVSEMIKEDVIRVRGFMFKTLDKRFWLISDLGVLYPSKTGNSRDLIIENKDIIPLVISAITPKHIKWMKTFITIDTIHVIGKVMGLIAFTVKYKDTNIPYTLTLKSHCFDIWECGVLTNSNDNGSFKIDCSFENKKFIVSYSDMRTIMLHLNDDNTCQIKDKRGNFNVGWKITEGSKIPIKNLEIEFCIK